MCIRSRTRVVKIDLAVLLLRTPDNLDINLLILGGVYHLNQHISLNIV